jgi:ribonuclease III
MTVCKRGLYNIKLTELETILGYKFKNLKLLEKALTHTSHFVKKSNINHFQRLEFLGDSVLNLTVSDFLYNKFPFFPEGKLSKLKSTIISQKFLAQLAKSIMLEKYIVLGKSVDLVKGRGKFSILADCMESCLGAIYLDGGLNPCKEIIIKLINNENIDFLIDDSIIKNYKSFLQEISQKKFNCLPVYKILKEKGFDHQKEFFVDVFVENNLFGNGIGKSKKEAEQNAAFNALKNMKAI